MDAVFYLMFWSKMCHWGVGGRRNTTHAQAEISKAMKPPPYIMAAIGSRWSLAALPLWADPRIETCWSSVEDDRDVNERCHSSWERAVEMLLPRRPRRCGEALFESPQHSPILTLLFLTSWVTSYPAGTILFGSQKHLKIQVQPETPRQTHRLRG